MTQSFAHLSDPHLTSLESVRPTQLLGKRLLGYLSWRRRRRFEHQADILQRLCDEIGREAQSQVVLTGDLTHVGLPDEITAACRWLRGIAAPDELVLVPGNHDATAPDSLPEATRQWADYMASDPEFAGPPGRPFPSLRIRGQLAFIGLSSACSTPPLLATGRVDADQLARLSGLLEETARRGLFRVVFIHHCPLPGVERWRKSLTNASAASAVLARHGAELVLHGHGHHAQYHELDSAVGLIPVVAAPSASASGLRGREAAGYNQFAVLSTGGGWELQHTRCSYLPDAGRFTRHATTTLHLERAHARH
jgi:3',5'-cyclic AMP phosphodiesterase CpdA